MVWEMGRESKWVSEEKKTGEREWRKVRVVVWITILITLLNTLEVNTINYV